MGVLSEKTHNFRSCWGGGGGGGGGFSQPPWPPWGRGPLSKTLTLFMTKIRSPLPAKIFVHTLFMTWPCLVPVRLSPRPSRSIDFGDVSQTNGPESTAVKRLSMREKLRGIVSFDSKNPSCGGDDGCVVLWVRSEIFFLLQWSSSVMIGRKKRNLWPEL